MEALKLLVEMVKDLPDMALYVIIAFFFYKTLIVGSIYGVIKLAIQKLHDAIIYKKTEYVEVEKLFVYDGGGSKKFIDDDAVSALYELCSELRARDSSYYEYIHASDVKKAIAILRDKRING